MCFRLKITLKEPFLNEPGTRGKCKNTSMITMLFAYFTKMKKCDRFWENGH